MNRPKVRIFTPYESVYSDKEITDYVKLCYFNWDFSYDLVYGYDFDYAIVITYTHDTGFKSIYNGSNLRNIIYFQYEPRIPVNSAVKKFLNSYKDNIFISYDMTRSNCMIMPVYNFNNIEKTNNNVVGIISSKKRHIKNKHFINRLDFIFNCLYKIPLFDHVLTRDSSFEDFKECKKTRYSNDSNIFKHLDHTKEEHIVSDNIKTFFDRKFKVYLDYKYAVHVESVYQPNFFTEKLIEPIMCECLCFYYGCPNADEYLDDRCFIRININDPNETIKIITNAINNNEWERRIEYIREEKKRIRENMAFPKILEQLLYIYI
jgi:hypothetical protein